MAETLSSLADLKTSAAAPAVTEAPVHVQKLDRQGRAYATGKRKNAVARVWIKPGRGQATVNGKPLDSLFRSARTAHDPEPAARRREPHHPIRPDGDGDRAAAFPDKPARCATASPRR